MIHSEVTSEGDHPACIRFETRPRPCYATCSPANRPRPPKSSFAWRIVAGPALARATDTSWTSDGILRLTPIDAAWRRELTRARAMLLDRLTGLLGPDVVRAITIDTVSESEQPPHA